MKKTLQNKKGFSLVELIIVMAIMAVLIGILAPQYIKYVERSRRTKAISNTKSVIDTISVVLTEKQAFNDPAFLDLYNMLVVGNASSSQPVTIDFRDPSSSGLTDLAQDILDTLGSNRDECYGIVTFEWDNDTGTVSYSVEFNDSTYVVDYNRTEDNADYVYADGLYKVRFKN